MNTQQQLREVYTDWLENYQNIFPPPQKSEIVNDASDWWGKNKWIWLSIIWSLIIAIGSRTGWSVYEINDTEGFGKLLSAVIAVLVVWGVEGYIAFYGLTRHRDIEIGWWERNVAGAAMFVGAFLSAVAGLDFVIDKASSWFADVFGTSVETTLSILLSIGLTFVLYGISEFAGRARWQYENLPLIREVQHRIREKEYGEQVAKAWKSSAEYLEIMGDKEREAAEKRFDIRDASYGRRKHNQERRALELELEKAERLAEIQGVQRTTNERRTVSGGNGFGDGEARKEIQEFIDDYLEEYGVFPEQSVVRDGTNRSRGYVSKIYNEVYDSYMSFDNE